MNPFAAASVRPDPQRHRAWALLSRVALRAPEQVADLVRAHGPAEAADRIVSGVIGGGYGPHDWRRAEHDLSRIAGLGGRLLTRDDPHWPARLADLDERGSGPVALWVLGPQEPNLLTSNMIAVVGAHASSDYGDHVAQYFAADLARRGWTVINGAGFGIAAAAHSAALLERAPSVAVLPCGIDRPYPPAHEQLLAQIATNGLVVSEYPPRVNVARTQIFARDRILVALSLGVLICEAGLSGGTPKLVGWANTLNRPVVAVPGPISSVSSIGCHQLIRNGYARLVSEVEHVLDVVAGAHRQP